MPFSVDTVTLQSPQHGRDIPPIVITFTIVLLQDWHRSASMIVREQPVSISAEYFAPSTYMLAAVQSHRTGNNVSRASSSLCNATLAVASMADDIENGATLSSRCDALAE